MKNETTGKILLTFNEPVSFSVGIEQQKPSQPLHLLFVVVGGPRHATASHVRLGNRLKVYKSRSS